METPQSPTGGDDRWRDLLAQYELVQMAAGLALQALVEAYKPRPDGMISDPPPEVLRRYRKACALRVVAEQALFDFVESHGRPH
jgi:hypothetical protein